MIDLEFDWGKSGKWFEHCISAEILQDRIYEKLLEVKTGDVVVDVGASIGPFVYSIAKKNPKKVFCIEPSPQYFETLVKNTEVLPIDVTCINAGIGPITGKSKMEVWLNGCDIDKSVEIKDADSISFRDFIKMYEIDHINFLKTDCEGGEYSIFNIENFSWIHANVDYIVGEWHLQSAEMIEQFVKFRDLYLRTFNKFEIHSVNGLNITHHLQDDWFINYFKQVIIHIDNSIKNNS